MAHVRPLAALCGLLLAISSLPVAAEAAERPVVDADSGAVSEGSAQGRATITVRLRKPAGARVVVRWRTVDGSAVAGEDYRAGQGRLVFGPDDTRKRVKVRVVDDGVEEPNERFHVRLTSTTARVATSAVDVVVRDDDGDGFGVGLADDARVQRRFQTEVGGGDHTLRGGTLRTEGPDGTRYTLVVPDGALRQPTTIAMTPWRAIRGSGVARGRLFGVTLAPAGTEFMRPLELRVVPPEPGPVEAEAMARHQGGEPYAFPVALDTQRIVLHLHHFSDYGGYIGEGIAIPLTADRPMPADPGEALAVELAHEMAAERDRALYGHDPDPEFNTRAENLLRAYYEEVVAPKLAGIRTDCAQGEAHSHTVLSFAQQAAMIGVLGAEQDAVFAALLEGAYNCLAEALHPCVDPDDRKQERRILGHARELRSLGGTLPSPGVLDPARHCKDLLAGTITLDARTVTQYGDFRTVEDWTLDLNLRMVTTNNGSGWYDDGRGSWIVTGRRTYEDNSPGAFCELEGDELLDGDGVFFTQPNQEPDSQEDVGKAAAELASFFPTRADNLGQTPALRVNALGRTSNTSYYTSGQDCVAVTQDQSRFFAPRYAPGTWYIPGDVVVVESGRGVEFNFTYHQDNSSGGNVNTYDLSVTGTLLPVRS